MNKFDSLLESAFLKFAHLINTELYTWLSSEINSFVLFFQPLHCSSKAFVASFLNNVVQKDTLNVDFVMRNAPILLDGTGPKTQKKKPKRKEVSAKKKRIHGVYNISTANQRFV